MSDDGDDRPTANRAGSIPQRVNYLFTKVLAPNGKPWPAAYVARWINDNGGRISSVYILKIRNGERVSPGIEYLEYLAKFFGVTFDFFRDSNPPEVDGAVLSAAIVLRDPELQSIMSRFLELSPESRKAASDVIDAMRRAERKKDPQRDTAGDD